MQTRNSFTKNPRKAALSCSDTQKCIFGRYKRQSTGNQADTPFIHWLDTPNQSHRARMEDTGIPFIFAIKSTPLKDGDKKEDIQAGA